MPLITGIAQPGGYDSSTNRPERAVAESAVLRCLELAGGRLDEGKARAGRAAHLNNVG